MQHWPERRRERVSERLVRIRGLRNEDIGGIFHLRFIDSAIGDDSSIRVSERTKERTIENF